MVFEWIRFIWLYDCSGGREAIPPKEVSGVGEEYAKKETHLRCKARQFSRLGETMEKPCRNSPDGVFLQLLFL